MSRNFKVIPPKAMKPRKLTHARFGRGIPTNPAADDRESSLRNLNIEELLHFSRLATIGELTACFAHEVANPLMMIRAHVRFLEEHLPAGHPLRSNFEVIERASRRIEEMGRRMLDFSRKRKRCAESCDAGELIWEALELVQPHLKIRSIEVKVHHAPDLRRIEVDRFQMIQALINLLQNAADSMAESDERILTITTGVESETMRIGISDTGTGIAPGHLKHIFEAFFTTKGDRGTGLGLFLTKQIVKGHHGSIDLETGNRGTTFVISLPL
jgi:two-component system, NtrC family, sensor kinase